MPRGLGRRQPQPFFNGWRFACLGLFLLSVLAYLPSLKGMKVWDDNALLNGSGIGGGDSLWNALTKPFLGAYFRPLISATFYAENLLWKGNPFFYHQTNILIHAFGSIALAGLLQEAFRSRRIAILGGLVFALAPAAVSTVAWIGGRTDSLCALLIILFVWGLLRALRCFGARRTVYCAFSIVCFFLAMLAKEQVLALILLVPAAVSTFGIYKPESRRVQAIRWMTPFAIAAGLFIAFWFLFYPNPFSAMHRDFAGQLMTAGQTGAYYALLVLFPTGRWMHMLSLGNFQAGGWGIALGGLAVWAFGFAGCFRLLLRQHPAGLFALLTLLALLPVSNLIPLPSLLIAPYRAGVAMIGCSGLIAYGLVSSYRRWPAMTVGVGAVWLGWCGALTVWGTTRWSDPITIFGTIISNDPSSIVTRRNLSLELLNAGRAEESLLQTDQILTDLYGSDRWHDPAFAVAQYSRDSELRRKVQENQGNEIRPGSWLGELFAQRGFALARIHDYPASKRSFDTALKIDRRNPRARVAFAQYALAGGKPEEAIGQLRIAQALHPGDPAIYALEGHAYGEIGRYELAEQLFKHSISMQPWFGPTYIDLADVQWKAGDAAGAVKTLESALRTQVRDSEEIQSKLAAMRGKAAGPGSSQP